MSTRNMHPRIVATLAELRAAGDHDAADDLEARYNAQAAEHIAGTTPAEQAAAAAVVIEAQADADVAVIEARADADEQVMTAAADAAAEVAEAEANTGDDAGAGVDDIGDVNDPQHDHWYFRKAHAK